MSRRGIVLVAIAMLCLACASPIVEREWIEATMPGFEITSSMSREDTLELARNLDLFWATVLRITNMKAIAPPIPTRIIAFESEIDYGAFGRRWQTAGFFRPGMRSNYVALVDSRSIDRTRVLLHELVHFILNNATTILYPLWYSEGFAEVLSTVQLRDDMVVVGAVPEDRVAAFQYLPWISLSRVVKSRQYDDFSRDELVMFYAESWALVHYLSLGREGSPDFGAEMKLYLELVESGKSDKVAFEEAFGATTDRTSRVLKRYLNSGVKAVGFPVEALNHEPAEPRLRVLSDAEISVRLGQLALAGGDGATAANLFETAVAADPTNPRAHAGLGDAHKFLEHWEAAGPHFERSLKLGADDALTQLDYAEYVHEDALRDEREKERSELLRKARRHYVRSQKLDPSIPEAYAMYGGTFLAPGEDPARGIDTLEHANRLLPANEQILRLLMTAYVATGATDEARMIVDRLVAYSHAGDRSGDADAILEEIEKKLRGGNDEDDE